MLSDDLHPTCSDGSGAAWANASARQTLVREPSRHKGTGNQLAREMAAHTRPDIRTTHRPLIAGRAEAERTVDPVWMAKAGSVLRDYLESHPEPFTTAETIWPLLDSTREKRAFSAVITSALRQRLMHEVGAVRLRGTYSTADGVEFTENKLVPRYQSLIVRS